MQNLHMRKNRRQLLVSSVTPKALELLLARANLPQDRKWHLPVIRNLGQDGWDGALRAARMTQVRSHRFHLFTVANSIKSQWPLIIGSASTNAQNSLGDEYMTDNYSILVYKVHLPVSLIQ